MNLEYDIKALLQQQLETLLKKYEALTARFSRLQDWLIHPFRSTATLEYEEAKVECIPDLLNLMGKRGIFAGASTRFFWGRQERRAGSVLIKTAGYWVKSE